MKQGYLSEYFSGICSKRLSAVEVDTETSNQHEFNGVEKLRDILGEPEGKERYTAQFLYFSDSQEEPTTDIGFLTWYDSRRKARLERGVMRWEYRLYFPTNEVTRSASAGDLLIIASPQETVENQPSLLAIVAEAGSTIERQLIWLFGLSDRANEQGFAVRTQLDTDHDRIGFASSTILEKIGVELKETAPNYLEEMLARFGGVFPKTNIFSQYARDTVPQVDSLASPDKALVAWMEQEEVLFRTLERHLLGAELEKLRASEVVEPDEYIRLTMSCIQRRKARAGSALENHIEEIFKANKVTYSRTPVTEKNLKPDFILPSISCYRDMVFPEAHLTMLGVKTTCKDRWRQILNEASRIPNKHLLTMEPSISENQTNEMIEERVQLVLPQSLHTTFTPNQQNWLMGISDFLELAVDRQSL